MYQTVIFMLEAVVFALIGVELPTLIRDLGQTGRWPLAAATIVISLIVQGFTLQPLARLAGFGPATAGPHHEETLARLRMAEAGLARLEELAEGGTAPDEVLDRLRTSLQARIETTRVTGSLAHLGGADQLARDGDGWFRTVGPRGPTMRNRPGPMQAAG